jgi:hypothetical protein
VASHTGHAQALVGLRVHLVAIKGQAGDTACELPEKKVAAQ